MRSLEFLETHSMFAPALRSGGTPVNYVRALIENCPIAIVVLDSGHRFTMCNPAFQQLFQYSPSELLKTDLDELIAGPERVDEASCLSRSVLRGVKVQTVARRRRRDGMMVDVEIYGIPLMVDDEVVGVYGMYKDVTEHLRAEREYGAAEKNRLPQARPIAVQLTERERQVMRLLADGLTNKEAATRLEISTRTVESHRINMSRKLGLSSLADLVRYAIRNGIVAEA